MTPLEAARKIMADGPRRIEDLWCALCQQPMESRSFIEAKPHALDCPWLMLPQIVRALEIAETAKYQCSGCAATVTDPLPEVSS